MIWLLLIPVLLYLFLLLDIFRNLLKVNPFAFSQNPSLRVSVIIACRNEENNLPDLLNGLFSQDYNHELFEVVIIDDNSTDSTFLIATAMRQIKNLKVLHNTSRGKKNAVATGISEASGELIITTDADCRPGRKWISTIAACYSETKADMIIAPVRLESKSGFTGRFSELEFLSLQGVTAGTAMAGNPVMCNGANLAFTKSAYRRHAANLHNEIASGEDIFLLHSLKREPDSKIVWLSSTDATITTSHTESIAGFIKQRSRWISKAKAYNDRYTLIISIVTFVTIITSVFLLISSIFYKEFLLLFFSSLILKSIPDFLILNNITVKYNKRKLMNWFVPSQIIYPFYVLIVSFRSLFAGNRWQ
jgi:biofilm PGA synthesis N-glycosyltransferase PgaC